MIKNERQYRITKAQLRSFEQALAELVREERVSIQKGDALKLRLHETALRSQVSDLESEVKEYESLRSNNPGIIEINSLDELPVALIRARIVSGLSQADLAERLGLKEQQIQRYEATEYSGVSLQRVKEVIDALGIQIKKELLLPTSQVSLGALFKRLKSVGLPKDFVEKRLIPSHLRQVLGGDARENLALQVASTVGRIFNWTPDVIFGDAPLSLENAILSSARFKVPARVSQQAVSAYTVYAHYLALLTAQATTKLTKEEICTDPVIVRRGILARYGDLSLASILCFLWDLGVPVIPLRDPGNFHGACWRIGGRNVIVVKQTTSSHARWIVDVLHEAFHAAQSPSQQEFTHVEVEEIFAPSSASISEERSATGFAVAVALDNRAEKLVEQCVKDARGKVEWLKRVVPAVASREGVDPAMLANYIAYRLSLQGINWWPSAASFQVTQISAWEVARNEFLRRVDLSGINESDRALLLQAFYEEDGDDTDEHPAYQ